MKTFACVLLALFALQGFTEARFIDEDTRGIADNIKDLIEKLEEEVHGFIKQLINKVHDVLEEIKDLVPEIIEQIKQLVQNEVSKVDAIIKKIIEEAVQAGHDVKDCVESYQPDIEALQNKIVEETQECVQKQVDEVNKIVGDAISEAQLIYNQVDELITKLKSCKNPICIIGVGKEAFEFGLQVKNDVVSIIQQVEKVVEEVRGEASVCLLNKNAEFAQAAAAIRENIQTCVANKIA